MKYQGSTQLRDAAKALSRAADALFDYEYTAPFQNSDDPRRKETDKAIAAAEWLIAEARKTYSED